MQKVAMILLVAVLIGIVFVSGMLAQTGNVVWFTSTVGTTLAANCPAAPANPSICLVGDGFWIWQNATTGWYQPPVSAASASLTINGIKKTLPAVFTLSTTAATISAPTASAPAITAQ